MVHRQNSRISDHLDALATRLRRFARDVKAGLEALHRVQFDEPWNDPHRPTYEEWRDFTAPRRPAPCRGAGTPAWR